MLILTLLLLLTAALFYNTIDLQKRQVIEGMRATSVDLKSSSLEHVVASSISPVFNKVLNDASLKVANEGFFNSPNDVVNYLWDNTENRIRNYLDNISKYYRDQGYNFTYSFNITNITMADGFTFEIHYIFKYTLSYNNGTIKRTGSVDSVQYVTVKTILDAYHYRKPTYIMPIKIYNPNNYDLTDFQVKIILNSSNFDFSIDPDGKKLRFVDEKNHYIPYWIEYWRYSNDGNDKAIIWIKVPKLKANKNTTIYLVSTYPNISESNGYLVFELFDDFEYDFSIGAHWNAYYGTWRYYNFSNNYLLYNSFYNKRVVGCENAPPVARMISYYNISLKNYTIEVVAMGNNNYRNWNAPNIMVGYLANPQYYGDTTTHPDAFYTLDLGGRYRNGYYALRTYYGDHLYWLRTQLFSGIMVCREYPYNYRYDYRIRVNYNSTPSPEKGTWYLIKILITEKEVDGDKVKEVNGTFTPLEDYIRYNIENPWMINTTIDDPYGSYFLLGTSWGDREGGNQHVYFDNFRVRKYAPKEPKVYVTGNIERIYPLIYISPGRDYGTHYGEGVSYNPYFVESEDPSRNYPSIVDMLAGRDENEWKYGRGIKLIGFYLPEN